MRSVVLAFAMLVAAGAALAQPPRQPPVRREVAAAEALLRSGDYAGAIAATDLALAAHPNDPVALAVRALSREGLGDYAGALRDHDAALLLAPQSVNAWTNACFARAVANIELDAALELCNRLIKAHPDWKAYETRGFLRLRRGEYDLALRDYAASLKQQPRMSSSLYGRGIARLRLGRVEEARADMAAAAQLQPDIQAIFARWGVSPD